jgi:hypothetical protein
MSRLVRARFGLIAFALLSLTACGGGGGGSRAPASPPSNNPPAADSNWDSLQWDADNWA